MLSFINNISTLKKLLMLLGVVIAGFSIIGYMAYSNIVEMRDQTNKIYFGTYIKALRLNSIIENYHAGVFESVYKYQNSLIGKGELTRLINSSKSSIVSQWSEYKNSYKSEVEAEAVKNADIKVINSFILVDELLSLLGDERRKVRHVDLERYFDAIDMTIKDIGGIIALEAQVSQERKNEINQKQRDAFDTLLIVLGVTFIVSIGISVFLAKSVQENEQKLLEVQKELEQANKNLYNLSLTDPMTKLYNRRFFEIVFEKEIKKAAREKSSMAFFMLDVDHFKLYNDTYGHQGGDEVLKRVSEALKGSFKRAGDYVFRLGGEEFGALSIGADSQHCAGIAKKILDNVKGLGIEHKASKTDTVVTVSVGGISFVPNHDTNKDEMVKKADEALYKAKESGRNRAVIIES